jgi:4-hydroxy-tetrahydrodipicolinate reductase
MRPAPNPDPAGGDAVRVVVFGLGRMGSGVVRLLAERGHAVVGAVCRRPENDGRDVGELAGIDPLGVRASTDADAVLAGVEADVAVHATHPHLSVVEPELAQLVEAGLDVLTLTEEAAYPWASHPQEAARLDALAKGKGVSLLASGINPGFLWDTLVGVFTLGSRAISAISIQRRTTLSALSEQTLAQMGIGLTVGEFEAAVARGDVFGHVGTRQSLELVGTALGWRLESFEETLNGVPEPGGDRVTGFRQLARAVFDGGSIEVRLEPRLWLEDTYDEIEFRGTPYRRLRITPAMEPMSTAQAVAVNLLPAVRAAAPGLRTMLDVPLPSARLGGVDAPAPATAGAAS